MVAAPTLELAQLGRWVSDLDYDDRRVLLGITGPPGAGKSTIASGLASAFGAPLVGMDGFHLAQPILEAQGWLDRKGAPHTFDANGFVALLRRLAGRQPGEPVFAPRYDRAAKNPIGSAVRVGPEDPLVIVEGNYLLLDESPWDEIASILEHCVYIDLDQATRVDRLIRRHVEFGKDPGTAERFVMESDEANARIVAASMSRADLVVRGV